jgi:hypothetical protein
VHPLADADTLPAAMTKLNSLSLVVLLWLGCGCETGGTRPPPLGASNAGSTAPAMPLAEQVKQLAATSTPGPKHAALAVLEGEWKVALSSLSASGTETDSFLGEATLTKILGGRFLRWDASIDFGGASGKTTGFLGYDSRYAEYVLMMISDLSQGMEVARGGGELQGPGIVFTLEQLDPRNGAHVRSRSRLRVIDHGHFVLEQLEPGGDGVDRVVRAWHYRRSTEPVHKT